MVSHTDAPRALRVEQPIASTPQAAWELIADITQETMTVTLQRLAAALEDVWLSYARSSVRA